MSCLFLYSVIIMLTDFAKIHCPLIRQTFSVNKEQWKKHGSSLQLKNPEVYLVVDRINPGFEWVFEDPNTIAVEKLDGTNIKILVENGRLVAVQNRKNIIDPLQILKGKTFIMEGVFNSIKKGFLEDNQEQAGELIGPKLQGNPYKLDQHEWYPFDKAIDNLRYKSFHDHDRTFENWSSWFKDHLFSLYYRKRATKLGLTDMVMAEGVIFYNLKRRDQNLPWKAKLRRNMFEWYYSDKITVMDYDPKAKDSAENQEDFD